MEAERDGDTLTARGCERGANLNCAARHLNGHFDPMGKRERLEQLRTIEIQRGHQPGPITISRHLPDDPAARGGQNPMNRQAVIVEEQQRRVTVEHDTVGVRLVGEPIKAIGPWMQERDPHELPLPCVATHPSPLPQQLLSCVHERRPQHARTGHPGAVKIRSDVAE